MSVYPFIVHTTRRRRRLWFFSYTYKDKRYTSPCQYETEEDAILAEAQDVLKRKEDENAGLQS